MKVTSSDPEWHETDRIAVSRTTRRGRARLHWFWVESGSRSWQGAGEWNGGIDRLETVHLADGVDIAAGTMAFILDALRSDGRHHVDIDDINLVVSQLGSQIARIPELPTLARRDSPTPERVEQLTTVRLIRKALYKEVLRRCR